MNRTAIFKKILLLSLLFFTLLFTACTETVSGDGVTMTVWVIDCGQGDAILVQFPDGTNMLVDGGPGKAAVDVMAFLEQQGVERLETVVATHPHEDHLGGLDDVIYNFMREERGIDVLYKTSAASDESFYSRFMNAVAKNGVPVRIPAVGDYLVGGPDTGWSVQCVGPVGMGHEDGNDDSLVLRVVCGDRAILLTGDAEVVSEMEMLDTGLELQADVLKVGHHGSHTASCDPFLDAVDPDFAVISCGAGNDYGHPHPEILEVASERGMGLFRTDLDGTIRIVTDGTELTVTAVGKNAE